MRRALPIFAYVTLIAGLALAAADAVRLAWADWLATGSTKESVARAVAVEPANPFWHGLLAEYQEAAGEDPKAELTKAAALSPQEARYWSRLAFRAETEQDVDTAEKHLLRAADVDRMFAPRWALANFYLRRGDAGRSDMDRFWRWLTKSIEMAPGELGAIFQVAWAVAGNNDKVRSVLPRQAQVLRQYVAWLSENKRLAEAAGAAQELAAQATAGDLNTLLQYCDMSALTDSAASVAVWNQLCRRKLLPYAELDPAAGHVVTDGSFVHDPLPNAFGWRLPPEPGISQGLTGDGNGVVIRLSGKQAERVGLLIQRIPLAEGVRYRLTYEHRVVGNAGQTGLVWQILGETATEGDLLEGSAPLASTQWLKVQTEFRSRQTYAPRLILLYNRVAGMVPWEGAVYVRNVDIEALP